MTHSHQQDSARVRRSSGTENIMQDRFEIEDGHNHIVLETDMTERSPRLIVTGYIAGEETFRASFPYSYWASITRHLDAAVAYLEERRNG